MLLIILPIGILFGQSLSDSTTAHGTPTASFVFKYMEEAITLVPGNTSVTTMATFGSTPAPITSNVSVLYVMKNNKQLNTGEFINLIGSPAKTEFDAWKNQAKRKPFLYLALGLGGTVIGASMFESESSMELGAIIGIVGGYGLIMALISPLDLINAKGKLNMLEWATRDDLQEWVINYNLNLQHSLGVEIE